jgi:glycosyltransferase involved in cell wall biosynthesis
MSRKFSRVLIVTDAWHPQVNGVVRTLMSTAFELRKRGLKVEMITPALFKTLPCPSYPEIRLSLTTSRRVERLIEQMRPDALHIATEGPLGWAARNAAVRRGWQFTTAYHTRFPEYVNARTGVPVGWLYRLFRKFHHPSAAVLVPTASMMLDLQEHGFSNVTYWTRGVDHEIFYPRSAQKPIDPANPIFIYVGRLAVEKNVEAFLALDLPGVKWVAGEGPLGAELRRRYPAARWTGVLSQPELAELYSRADVFVFPSKTDTFGLVMVEAMACGLPVAAFPVVGPIDVVGDSGAGCLDQDLRTACLKALEISRSAAIAHAKTFTWALATEQFYEALVPLVPVSNSGSVLQHQAAQLQKEATYE